MEYFLDGYNLFFWMTKESKSFSKERIEFIQSLQTYFRKLHLSGFLIFDGRHRREEESGRSYDDPLEIIYAPLGQTADSYIIEKLSVFKNPKEAIVVTNDKGLSSHARALNVIVMNNHSFLTYLLNKSSSHQETKKKKESSQNIERLLKIFERKSDTEDNSSF